MAGTPVSEARKAHVFGVPLKKHVAGKDKPIDKGRSRGKPQLTHAVGNDCQAETSEENKMTGAQLTGSQARASRGRVTTQTPATKTKHQTF